MNKILFFTAISLFILVFSGHALSISTGNVLHLHLNNQSQYGENDLKMHDFSGTNNNGKTATNGAKWNSSAGMSGAYDFDGYNDKITVKDSNSLSPSTTNQYTITYWAKFKKTTFVGEGYQKNYINFMGKGSTGNNEFLFRQYNKTNSEGRNDRISFYVFNLSGGLGAGSYFQEPIPLGEWMFITGVFNSTHTQIWKNGVLKDADPVSEYGIHMQNGNAPLNLGTLSGSKYWKGTLDEIKVYNKALKAQEIQALYQEGSFSS